MQTSRLLGALAAFVAGISACGEGPSGVASSLVLARVSAGEAYTCGLTPGGAAYC